jgi:RNA polymerase sigma-70 factor (ECF subfamily)
MTTEEFKQRVLPVKDKIYRLAKRILNDIEESEDVVQEVFYRLWSRKDKIGAYKSIEAFAMVVTKNMCLDKIKAKGYYKDQLGEWNNPVDYKSPDKITEIRDDLQSVHQAMVQLPEQQRMIIQMRDVEGMEYEEIAEIMQMNLNAIRVSLSRARKTIRDKIIKKQEYEYQGN